MQSPELLHEKPVGCRFFFISGTICESIIASGFHFVKGYAWLANASWAKGLCRFPLMPKGHMLFHILHTMREQWSNHKFIENPMNMSCASDEDFIGRFCELTRKVSPRQRIRRSIERYLSQVLLLWYRKAN